MFGIFKKEKQLTRTNAYPDLSFLHTDIHSHFIPGIDDGAQDMETSMQLISGLAEMGYRKVITTPHIKWGNFSNTSEKILYGLDTVQQAVSAHNIPVKVEAAAEYFLDEHFEELLRKGDLLCITQNQVLIEISFLAAPFNLPALLFDMQTKGYQPILAHPERYGYYHHQFEEYAHFKELGCLLQLNINSLTGYYGKEVKAIANKLLSENLIDYLGSDMHHSKHLQMMQSLAVHKDILRRLQEYPFLNKQLV